MHVSSMRPSIFVDCRIPNTQEDGAWQVLGTDPRIYQQMLELLWWFHDSSVK